MKLGIDVMGGDYAPEETCKGVALALKEFPDVSFVVYGNEEEMKKYLVESDRVKFVHTPVPVDMGEHDPITFLRKNRNASLALALKDAKDHVTDGVVSCGPTQTLIVGTHLFLKRMDGMDRVALCPVIPDVTGKGKLLLDVGANVELRPEHLQSLAYCAVSACKCLGLSTDPKVGLLNIGTEDGKGREVDQETNLLFKQDSKIHYIGQVEPKELFTSEADILMTDGFTGNMVMKSLEGTAKGTGQILKAEIKRSVWASIGYVLFMKKTFKRYKARLSADEIGGAMVLGANSPVVKAHGSSDAYAFKNAIRLCKNLVEKHLIENIKETLKEETKE